MHVASVAVSAMAAMSMTTGCYAFFTVPSGAVPSSPFGMKTPKTPSPSAATSALEAGRTLFDKIWDDHSVDSSDGTSTLLYVDRHLVHEVTSPQAFEGLRMARRGVRRPDCTLVTVDHNVPTSDRSGLIDVSAFIEETASRIQVLQLEQNVADFGLKYFGMADERQGIVHIIGPEQGFTLPGCVTVCGDSHTATHGAFGALAFGIGTSEVEHVLATQVRERRRESGDETTADARRDENERETREGGKLYALSHHFIYSYIPPCRLLSRGLTRGLTSARCRLFCCFTTPNAHCTVPFLCDP